MTEPDIYSTFSECDAQFDTPIRPKSLDEFIGQEDVKERLHVLIEAATQRGDPLGHCLFAGPPGLGKTTLAHILAKQMGKNIVVTTGPTLDKPGDLAGILTSLEEGDILFVDEIHRMQKNVEEYLYPAMEDFALDLVIDSGAAARTVQINLKPFTLVGATTRTGLLSGPLRSRFATTCRLDYYKPDVLSKVVMRTSNLLQLSMDSRHALQIAERARGTPRVANHLLRWVRDYAQVKADGLLSDSVIEKSLSMLSIDAMGLDEMDLRILTLMRDHYNGGPVGLSTIAAALGEEAHTIEEVHEPYLILQGLIKKTPKGRVITERGLGHLGE